MDNETVVAASSAAEEKDVFEGKNPTFAEFSSYRQTGELPDRFKPAETADTASDDAPKETADSTEGDEPKTEPDSDPDDDSQDDPPQKGSGAEKRIKQLLAKVKELERNQPAKPDVVQESSTPPPAPGTRPKPTADSKDDKGNPKYTTYEDFVEDLADWKAEQKVASYEQKQVQQEALRATTAKMDEARARYEDADATIFPAAKTIYEARIPQAVKEVFSQSDLYIDLCYVVGSDPDELKSFISLAQINPRAAIGKIFDYERTIREELGKEKPESGRTPETRKTGAPKPPTPVSGSSSRAFDVSDESLSPEEWSRKRTAQINKGK